MGEKPNFFCPKDCNFLEEGYQASIKKGETYDVCHRDCHHKEDKLVEPYPITEWNRGWDRYDHHTIVGTSGDTLYTSDGQMVNANSPFISGREVQQSIKKNAQEYGKKFHKGK